MIKSALLTRPSLDAISWGVMGSAVLLGLAACSAPPPSPDLPRPVRVAQVEQTAAQSSAGYAGQVTVRRETALAFRVGGKLETRLVEVGDRVRKGQALARLDNSDYRLATQALKARLAAAKAEQALSRADLGRYRELLAQRVIAPPEFERHLTADTAVREKVAALEAELAQAQNQLRYAELRVDRDGVVTAIAVEAGDVVSAGQGVARLAQEDEKEVSFQVPEQGIAAVEVGREVEVSLWSLEERRLVGIVREVAPAADPATRTYRVKATLLGDGEQTRLGMTATVWLTSAQSPVLSIPRSAVFTGHVDPNQTRVWRVEAGAVHSIPVTPGRMLEGERVEVAGLEPGQTVVSAGVQRLLEGQAVRVLAGSNGSARP